MIHHVHTSKYLYHILVKCTYRITMLEPWNIVKIEEAAKVT